MYHALEDAEHPAGSKDAGEQLYVLQVSQFREQMEYLHREGYRTFLLDELQALAEWPDKAVVLTFDDGHESNFTLALPILQEFGFKAEFFITTGWIGRPHYMTEGQVKALSEAGMGIGSHGVSHYFMDDLTNSEIESELSKSMAMLENIIGNKVTSFSAPGGRMQRGVVCVAKKLGYQTIHNSQPALFTRGSSRYAIPRFSLTQDTRQDEFSAIIEKNRVFMRNLKIRNNILQLVKKTLGNKRYEMVRATFLTSVK
jgi:peptidoglycan/xylan/chitin deacetylase (PgdA/CDA1 family)